MNNDEQRQVLEEMFQKAKVKIFPKDQDNLLANAQVLLAGTLEINGISIWKSKYPGNPLNIKPPSYDRFYKCKAVWINDPKIWAGLCQRLETEYQSKREELGINDSLEEIDF